MTPYKIPCPDCGAPLKISDPAHIGKMTKCPKCRGLMKITPPDDEGFLSNVDSNEYEDLPYEPDPEPAPRPKKKPTKRPTRPSNTNPMGKQIGIAIAVIIGLVVGFLSTNGKFNLGDALGWIGGGPSGISPDLTWLPDGLDSVGEVRVSQLVQTPAVTEALKQPEAIAGVAMMTGIVGFNLHDVDSVRFGLMATPTPDANGRFAGIVKLLKPGRVAAVLEAATGSMPPGATKTPHGSRLLYSLAAYPVMSVCCLDEQTILFGTTAELKSVLDKEGKPESTSRFAIVDKPHQLVVVVAPSKPENAQGYLGDGNLELFSKTPTTALSFSADLDSMIHAVVALQTKSSKSAHEAKTDLENGIKNFSRSPLAVTVSKELQQALNTVKVTVAGRMVTVTGDVPTNALVSAIAASDPDFGGTGLPPSTTPAIEFNPSSLEIPPAVITEPAPGTTPAQSITIPAAPVVTPPPSNRPPRPGDQPQAPPARRPSGF